MDWIKNSITKPKKKESSSSTSIRPLAEVFLRNGVNEEFARERLTGANLPGLVIMPTGLDPNEWFASHTVAFFEHTSLLYGCIADVCQSTCCQSSPASTSSTTYQWVDDKGKKLKCHAPQYIDHVMSYVQKCVGDEATFPTKYGNKFPQNFESTVRKIHLRLQHVLDHIFVSHLKDIVHLQLQACLNTVFYHFYLFHRQFHLIDEKDASDILDRFFQLLRKSAEEAAAERRQGPDPSSATMPSRSLTPPPMSNSSPRHLSLSQPRHRSERSPASKALLGQSSRIKSPFKSKEGVARDRKSSTPFRPLSIAT